MNFFQHQDRARRRTLLLAFYFLLALAAVVAAVNLTCWLLWHWWLAPGPAAGPWFASEAFWWITLGTLGLLVTGSLRKAWQLRHGGEGLADMLGAREIASHSDEPAERRLRNVVEEMSLAAGTIMPRTYVLPGETGINAFVAGATPARAVLVVTEGALAQLDRDELQGVVAHEFSHILNGDVRLNLRLMAALAGVLTVGKLGEFLIHISPGDRRRSRGLPVLAGLVLMTIGYAGLFFGRLIKAAISRQRERLADASAVQFTRQPAGLAGALIKIRNGNGSHLHSVHAEDLSHMGFAETLAIRLRRLLATHPPLDRRLHALGADWAARARVRARATQPPGRANAPSERIGRLDDGNLGYARTLIEALPDGLYQALHAQEGAECVLYALALGDTRPPPALRAGRRAALVDQVSALGTRLRLPLLDLALATLRQAQPGRRPVILKQLRALTLRRRDHDLLCWALTAIAERHLGAPHRALPRPDIHRLAAVANDIQVVFSALAWAGDSARGTALANFQRATHGLLPAGRLLLAPERCMPSRLDPAMARLTRLTPLLKAPLIDAAADLVLADGKVQVAEAELLRALCTLLDSPMPPLFGTPTRRSG
ncbi:MAG TPA: M48 family metalloprotease [Alcanivorax sp.]|nr:M48 family metalloprotease [Alcanivorax sp.]